MIGPEIEALRKLYAEPDNAAVERLAAQCIDLSDCISAQLLELARNPSRDRCDRVLHNLAGVAQHIRRLAAALELEQDSPPEAA